jgi:hypothetical protein
MPIDGFALTIPGSLAASATHTTVLLIGGKMEHVGGD